MILLLILRYGKGIINWIFMPAKLYYTWIRFFCNFTRKKWTWETVVWSFPVFFYRLIYHYYFLKWNLNRFFFWHLCSSSHNRFLALVSTKGWRNTFIWNDLRFVLQFISGKLLGAFTFLDCVLSSFLNLHYIGHLYLIEVLFTRY